MVVFMRDSDEMTYDDDIQNHAEIVAAREIIEIYTVDDEDGEHTPLIII